MSEQEAAETADSDRGPPRSWEEHAQHVARVTDPHLHRALVSAIERDREQWAQRARYLVELRTMKREIEERDARIFSELAALLTLGKSTNALALGTAARVARLDNEREVTRQEVRDVHRWAEELKRDADTSHQGAVVTADRAVKALAEVADAKIGEARAQAQLEVTRGALQSVTTEITVKKTEGRARSWSVKSALLGAGIFVATSGLGAFGKWLFDKLTGGK